MSRKSTRTSTPRHAGVALAAALVALVLALPVHANNFRTLDRQSTDSKADAAFSFVIPTALVGSLMRTDLYAQAQWGSWGVYGSLPVSTTIGITPGATTQGNLEGGIVHAWDITGPFSLVTHVGGSFATAGNSPTDILLNAASHASRPNEVFIAAVPNQYALRIATSPRVDLGPVFLQGDLGFDFAFPSGINAQTYMRANVGAGVNLLFATLTGEFTNTGDIAGGVFNGWLSAATLGLSFNTPFLKPYAAFTSPLNGGLAGNVYEVTFGASLTF